MWRNNDLLGALAIDRVCDLFEIHHPRIPGGRFKIKVLERGSGDYLAVPNVFVKSADGTPDHISGLGRSPGEALEDLLARFLPSLKNVATDDPEIFDWSDPHDF